MVCTRSASRIARVVARPDSRQARATSLACEVLITAYAVGRHPANDHFIEADRVGGGFQHGHLAEKVVLGGGDHAGWAMVFSYPLNGSFSSCMAAIHMLKAAPCPSSALKTRLKEDKKQGAYIDFTFLAIEFVNKKTYILQITNSWKRDVQIPSFGTGTQCDPGASIQSVDWGRLAGLCQKRMKYPVEFFLMGDKGYVPRPCDGDFLIAAALRSIIIK